MQLWTSKNYHKNDKIYRGSFNYFRNENQYAEETFDVYRDKKEQTFHYVSEVIARVSTGEILTIHVEYVVNKEFIPIFVMIEKLMGKDFSKEIYEYNVKRNFILYAIKNSKGDEEKMEIATAPKFHIATAASACSMLFLRSKKLDSSGKNSFNFLIGNNQWDFKETPKFKNVIVERANLTNEKINIEGQNVQATQYKIFDDGEDLKSVKEPAHIRVYISQHGGIPYLIKGEDGTKIQIKFLNDLSDKE
jgi:hypothetical protein